MVVDLKNIPGSNKFPIYIKPLSMFSNVHKALQDNQSLGKIYALDVGYNISIIQIGAGGTGGYVFAEMMRYISNLPKHIQHRIHYTLCDGDTFEAKNIRRQLCTEDDIGKNKAEALVEKVLDTYNIMDTSIEAYPYYIKNAAQLEHLSSGPIEATPKADRVNIGVLNSNIVSKLNLSKEDSNSIVYKPGLTNYHVLALTEDEEHGPTITYMPKVYTIGNEDNDEEQNSITIPSNFKLIFGRFTHCIHRGEDLTDTHFSRELYPFLEDFETDFNDIYSRPICNYVPIIIDCVDKTEVRGIINAFFESCMFNPSISKLEYNNLIRSIINNISNDYLFSSTYKANINKSFVKWNQTSLASSAKDFVDHPEKYKVNLVKRSFVLVNKETNEINPISLNDLLTDLGHPCIAMTGGESSIPVMGSIYNQREMYLISSGNGEFTGQVGWGRVSFFKGEESKPISYIDIFGDEERAGNSFSKDNKDTQLTTITSTLASKYATPIRSPLIVGDKLILHSSDLSNNVEIDRSYSFDHKAIENLFRYYYSFDKKYNEIYSKNSNLNKTIEDYSIDSLEIYKQFGINAYTATNTFNKRYFNRDLQNFKSNFSESMSEEYNFNTLYTLTEVDTSLTSLKLNLKTGNIMPYEFKNFDQWCAQYISVPTPYMVYPELLDIEEDLKEEQLSCAQRAVENVQSMQANKTAANLVVNFAIQILEGLTDGGRWIDTSCVSFDTRNNSYYSNLITTDFLKQYDFKVTDITKDALKIIGDYKTPREIYFEKHPKEEIHEIDI